MAERFCKVCRGWHDLDKPWPQSCLKLGRARRSHLPAPNMILDTMEPVQSMHDGKMYDSKAALRQTYKDAGLVEVGDDSSVMDPKPRPKSKPNRENVRASVRKAFSQAGLGA